MAPLFTILEPATSLPTQTLLVEIHPVTIRIIDRDFRSGIDALRHQYDTLLTEPEEALVLAVWVAGMIDEASKIALAALPDLIRG